MINLLNEPLILKIINQSNFVPIIISSFQDYDNYYIVTKFYDGPILMQFVYHNLSEKQIKFICACAIISLKYLREKEIIHRDLTFHNIIMDNDYYFNLIDFSFAVNYSNRNSKEYSSDVNPSFSAPELLNNSDYNYNSDYYRLGSLIFFIIFKKFPIKYNNSFKIFELSDKYNLTKNYTKNLFDFIERLIKRNMETRLGYNNIDELINHSWFNGFDWEKLQKKQIISPFKNITINNNIHKCKKFNKTKKGIERYAKLTETN